MWNSGLLIDYIGFLAATITGIALIPQAVQIWKNRNYSCISVFVYSLFTGGSATWLLYGLLIHRWPLILSNIVSLLLAASILTLKIRSTRKR